MATSTRFDPSFDALPATAQDLTVGYGRFSVGAIIDTLTRSLDAHHAYEGALRRGKTPDAAASEAFETCFAPRR
ncbi:MAG: hypothetical protein NW217_07545 [Hyphomicrobiaceae bacterium]|nr:hypothetical protein [Hyphomicrobiaceae bacterium]